MRFSEFKERIQSTNQPTQVLTNDESQNLEFILEVTNKINSTLILDEVLELVLKDAISFTNSERGFILLSNFDDQLEFKLGLNKNGEQLTSNDANVSMSTVQNVYLSGESVFIESAQNYFDKKTNTSIFNLELQTILCSPLVSRNKKIGVIYVDSKNLNKIRLDSITKTFEIFAGQAATAINNAQLYRSQIQSMHKLQETNMKLEKAMQASEKAAKLKSEFISQMSHEIRTPLHIIVSNLDYIHTDFNHLVTENSELKTAFDSIKTASDRIIRTLDLILDHSEMKSGTYEPKFEQVSLVHDILAPIIRENEINAMKKGLKIEFLFSDEGIVDGDKYSLHQIFTNLIDNSIKFTNRGKITVNTSRDIRDRVVVNITDTGIGISEDFLPYLFDIFSQEDQGYSRRYEGNGLGLSLVKKFCELNKAKIRFNTQKGIGTSFSIIF
jgi:signal transduction histidine kinase